MYRSYKHLNEEPQTEKRVNLKKYKVSYRT